MTTYMDKERLACKFTDDEIIEMVHHLAECIRDHKAAADAKAADTERHNKKLKGLSAEIERLSTGIADGEEERVVDVEVIRDIQAGVKRYVRLDTGETYKECPLTGDESQATIDDYDGDTAPGAEGDAGDGEAEDEGEIE